MDTSIKQTIVKEKDERSIEDSLSFLEKKPTVVNTTIIKFSSMVSFRELVFCITKKSVKVENALLDLETGVPVYFLCYLRWGQLVAAATDLYG